MSTVITVPLHRVQHGHGRGFVRDAPVLRLPVRRPARVAIMLAFAHMLEAAIRAGRLCGHGDAARRLGLTPPRISQLLGLLQLAPDLQERVLFLEAVDGAEPLTERTLRRITAVLCWEDQRAMWPKV